MTIDHDDLDRRVRAHVGSQLLDPSALGRMRRIASGPAEPIIRPRHAWLRNPFLGFAAAIVMGAIVLGWFSSGWLEEEVAGEIALNHRKELKPEIFTDAYAHLGPRMDRLDFVPVEPRRLRAGGNRLVGARYCSVGNQIAVQIRLVDPRGSSLTLYEFRPGRRYAALTEAAHVFDGVEVTVWREGELVFGLARNTP